MSTLSVQYTLVKQRNLFVNAEKCLKTLFVIQIGKTVSMALKKPPNTAHSLSDVCYREMFPPGWHKPTKGKKTLDHWCSSKHHLLLLFCSQLDCLKSLNRAYTLQSTAKGGGFFFYLAKFNCSKSLKKKNYWLKPLRWSPAIK